MIIVLQLYNLERLEDSKDAKKLKNKPQLQYKNMVKENLHKQYNIRRNQPFHKGNHFSNFSDENDTFCKFNAT